MAGPTPDAIDEIKNIDPIAGPMLASEVAVASPPVKVFRRKFALVVTPGGVINSGSVVIIPLGKLLL